MLTIEMHADEAIIATELISTIFVREISSLFPVWEVC